MHTARRLRPLLSWSLLGCLSAISFCGPGLHLFTHASHGEAHSSPSHHAHADHDHADHDHARHHARHHEASPPCDDQEATPAYRHRMSPHSHDCAVCSYLAQSVGYLAENEVRQGFVSTSAPRLAGRNAVVAAALFVLGPRGPPSA